MGGRVVLVTGATSGIGRASALAAAARGDDVALLARNAGVLDVVAADCTARGAGRVLVLPTDVSDDAAVRAAVEQVVGTLGRVDGVVHSAGVVAYGRVDAVPVDVFDQVVRTNLLGSVNLARHVLPVMRGQGAGTFVQVGSVIGHTAVPGMASYAVSKWGVRSLVRQLRIENRDVPGVEVCYLAPGGVDTPIYLQAGNYAGPVGRPPAPVVTPERVARVALRLLDRPRPRVQVGPANGVLRLASALAPDWSDRVLARVFPLGATDLTTTVPPGPGNVLEPVGVGERLRGRQGNAVLGALRNVRAVLARHRAARRGA